MSCVAYCITYRVSFNCAYNAYQCVRIAHIPCTLYPLLFFLWLSDIFWRGVRSAGLHMKVSQSNLNPFLDWLHGLGRRRYWFQQYMRSIKYCTWRIACCEPQHYLSGSMCNCVVLESITVCNHYANKYRRYYIGGRSQSCSCQCSCSFTVIQSY